MRVLRFSVLPCLLAGLAFTEVTSAHTVSIVPVPVPSVIITNSGGATLEGYQCFDVMITTNNDWQAASVLLELSQGSIYQEALISHAEQPHPAFWPWTPSAEYDTYVYDPHGVGGIAGAAGDVGGDFYQFDTQQLDISWYSIGSDLDDVGTFPIARITLSPDAVGTLSIATLVAGESPQYLYDILIPEPASIGLLSTGGMLIIRRKNRLI